MTSEKSDGRRGFGRIHVGLRLGTGRLIRALDLPLRGSVLDVGCGDGALAVRIAKDHPDARVYGIDADPVAIERARQRIERAEIADRVEVAVADPTTFDVAALFGQIVFDRVFCSYTLSAHLQWTAILARCHRATGPDGRVLALDFGMPERAAGLVRPLLHRAARVSGVTPRGELKEAFLALARRDGRAVRIERPWAGYAQLLSIV